MHILYSDNDVYVIWSDLNISELSEQLMQLLLVFIWVLIILVSHGSIAVMPMQGIGYNAVTGPRAQKAPFLKSPPGVFCLFLINNDARMKNIGSKLKPVDLYCLTIINMIIDVTSRQWWNIKLKSYFFLKTFVVW